MLHVKDYELRFDLGLRRAFGDARLSNPQVPLFGSPPVFSELQLNHKGQQVRLKPTTRF